MIFAALAIAAQLANPGFEQDLQGWQVDGRRGMRTYVAGNPGYLPRQSAEGER